MKASDTPSPPSTAPRSYLPRLIDPLEVPDEKEDRFQPRYVDLPKAGEHGPGTRNLALGVAALFLALVLLGFGIFLSGGQAALAVVICLLTCTALFVLARLHLFQQRNGGFLALGVVCLLGAIFPLVEHAFIAADALAKQRTAPAAIAANPARPAEALPPLLTESFALGKPDTKAPHIRVLKDSRVLIGEKPFLIKAGDLFPLVETQGEEAIFEVRNLHVALPLAVVQVNDPKAQAMRDAAAAAKATLPEGAADLPKSGSGPATAAELAEVTLSAQREAIRRYPALGIKDSLENTVFVATYQQLKDTGGQDFFGNPEWPLELAELLAKREGWSREGRPATTGPAPMANLPSVSDGTEPPLTSEPALPDADPLNR